MPGVTPTLAGAGSFRGAYGATLSGLVTSIGSFPVAPTVANGMRRVTLTVAGNIPPATISDLDGSVYASVGGQATGTAQWTCTLVQAHAVGGNNVTVVFPNAVQKGNTPTILIEDFNPLGS